MPGSSPLARGTRRRASLQPAGHRFIPARAGNIRRPSPAPWPAPVHPRSRGEHRSRGRAGDRAIGSSPLARGTRDHTRPPRAGGRFIPARAGNTSRPARARPTTPVHPHSRGEHLRKFSRPQAGAGSSPLARGTRGRGRDPQRRRRFIPARAGNTWRPTPRGCAGPVHPRSRGEHRGGSWRAGTSCGSSPLARGTRRAGRGRRALDRFIPARAGNTFQ